MRGIIFRTAKAAFRKAFRKHKSQVARAKKDAKRGIRGTGIEPYDLVKADIKRKIRGTKFTASAEFKAQPGLKRRIRVGIERAKREKKKFRKPVIFGKAYASDKKGKTMQIQPLTIAQRRLMKKEMAESANRLYRKMFLEKKKKGGLHTIKMVKRKLEKASAAHAGQAKALGKVIGKKKMLMGGLLTSGIKAAAKKYFKHGNKTQQIINKHGGKRSHAKDDVKSGIRDELKGKLSQKEYSISSPFYNKKLRRQLIRDINLLKK
ncbi:hypothetical protein [Hyphomonas sp.]|mgnify:FL=1|uniref:hypothetical protein n=1 Tax=Hyphomonas sp. TaxID=87 RepID=UPI000C8D2FA2|nr:hypothetical protein [Hyphomonas sp.]MAL47005.1 hypothetical protein [Hyphomonas sp.]